MSLTISICTIVTSPTPTRRPGGNGSTGGRGGFLNILINAHSDWLNGYRYCVVVAGVAGGQYHAPDDHLQQSFIQVSRVEPTDARASTRTGVDRW